MPTAEEFNSWSAETLMGAHQKPGEYGNYWISDDYQNLGYTKQGEDFPDFVIPEWTPYTDRNQMALVLERVPDSNIRHRILLELLNIVSPCDLGWEDWDNISVVGLSSWSLLTASPQQIAAAVWRAWHE